MGGGSKTETDIPGDRVMPVSNGELYTKNNGWLLIIPQEITNVVRMSVETKKMGLVQFELPGVTLTDIAGNPDPTGKHFVAGHRYTYTIHFREAEPTVEIEINPWNELYSSSEIDFNS